MPIFIPAAISTVARYLARHGVTKAINKYGKKAVDQARKFDKAVDDTLGKAQGITSKTPGRKSKTAGIIVGKKRVKADKRTQAIKGAALGAAGVEAIRGVTGSKPKPKPKPKRNGKDSRVDPKAYPTYKKQSKPAVSFREAQRKAKRNKQKTFTWEGRRYNTAEA